MAVIAKHYFKNKPIEEADPEVMRAFIIDQYDVGRNKWLQWRIASQRQEIARLYEEIKRLKTGE